MQSSAASEKTTQSWALIADADPHRAQVHRHLLEAAELSVFLARDGEEARQLLLGRGAPAIVLTDLSLARVDGFALIKLIRGRASRETTKIIALSAVAALRTTAQQKQAELELSGLLASWAPVDTVNRTILKALREPAIAPPAPASPSVAAPAAAKPPSASLPKPPSISPPRPPSSSRPETRREAPPAPPMLSFAAPPPRLAPALELPDESGAPLELRDANEPLFGEAPDAPGAIDERAPGTAPEPERLLAIERLVPKDNRPPPEELQQIVDQVARRFGVSASMISIILKDRQWARAASIGYAGAEGGLARGDAFCTHVVQGNAPLVVPDATIHPYFSQNPLVREGRLRSYAGAPLVTPEGAVLGSLCIIDAKPMTISSKEVDELVEVARQVAGELELSRIRRERAQGQGMPFSSARGLDKSESRVHSWFDAVLDNIEEGILFLDEARQVTMVNRAMSRLLERPADDLIGKSREQLVKELAAQFEDPEDFIQQLKVPATGPYALRAIATTHTGRTLRWVTRPVLLERGTGHMIVLVDISEPESV